MSSFDLRIWLAVGVDEDASEDRLSIELEGDMEGKLDGAARIFACFNFKFSDFLAETRTGVLLLELEVWGRRLNSDFFLKLSDNIFCFGLERSGDIIFEGTRLSSAGFTEIVAGDRFPET